jgi:hypothetical protein
VAAGGKQHAGAGGGDVFDVRVVAFAGGSARTLQALQVLFGLDRDAAQRLVDNVPLVVRRAAPANEARNYVEVLRGIGAEVALERPDASPPTAAAPQAQKPLPPPPGQRKPPPPPQAKVPPPAPKAAPVQIKVAAPAPRDAEAAPKPALRQHTADLEFDLATPGARDAEPQSAVKPIKGTAKRRNEIEFAGGDTGTLELDVDPVRAPQKRAEDKSETPTGKEHARPLAAGSGEAPVAAPLSDAGRPMSRAAVVHKPGIVDKEPYSRQRQLALLRMLGAVSLGAAGIWLDSSIIYGNASLLSVILHGLAIYQFGVGLRGILP